MKTWQKVAIGVGAVVVLGGIIAGSIANKNKGIVEVQTAKIAREDISSVVSASGEIRPKTYVNLGSNAFGKITHLYVKEGDQVKTGQLVAQLENVQPAADVASTRASVNMAETDTAASAAGVKTAEANLVKANSEAERAKFDYDRADGLYKSQLIAKQDFDVKKAAWDSAQAGVGQAKAQLAQAKAQLDSAAGHITQNKANLTRFTDVLKKTTYTSPFDGVVTNLPVREGETVVVGIQNSPGSTLMTIADLSVITAEVRVDETDVVNVKLGQSAEVKIDAIPGKVFRGTVTQIGDNAIVRSTGVSTSQGNTASQEAKDFKVVVTLSDPPAGIRPGLSTTAKITTATRTNALAIPIQALTVRRAADLIPVGGKPATPTPGAKEDKTETQGVFVVHSGKVDFLKVETGVSGTTDIEVLSGPKEGDEIITGSYKVLRTIKPGTSVKVNNSAPKKTDSSS